MIANSEFRIKFFGPVSQRCAWVEQEANAAEAPSKKNSFFINIFKCMISIRSIKKNFDS
jgi:hypothetical protein